MCEPWDNSKTLWKIILSWWYDCSVPSCASSSRTLFMILHQPYNLLWLSSRSRLKTHLF